MNNIQIRCLQMLVLLIATALMLVACISLALIPSAAPPMDSLSMVDAFHDAVNSEDVDAVLALFADSAVVTDNGSVILGRDEIRTWLMCSQRMAGLHLTMLHSEINGEYVIWFDTAHHGPEVEHVLYILRWEAVIRDGEIQSLAAMPRYRPDLK